MSCWTASSVKDGNSPVASTGVDEPCCWCDWSKREHSKGEYYVDSKRVRGIADE